MAENKPRSLNKKLPSPTTNEIHYTNLLDENCFSMNAVADLRKQVQKEMLNVLVLMSGFVQENQISILKRDFSQLNALKDKDSIIVSQLPLVDLAGNHLRTRNTDSELCKAACDEVC